MAEIIYTIKTQIGEITIPEFDNDGDMELKLHDIHIYLTKDQVISLIDKLTIQLNKLE